jgi:2-methylcitrate dehydratase PrpD
MMAQKTLSQILGDFAHDLSYRDLSPEIIEKAQISVADGIACALAVHDLPSSRIARNLWKDLKKEGQATAWVNGETGDPENTAWVNCIHMHGILHDDMQESTVGHMGSFVIPAAYAVAEQEGKGGRDILPAIVAGYEVSGRIAVKSGLPVVRRGFRASPVFGPFAAATVAGKLMGLSREQMHQAIACAASFSCGLLEAVNTGSMEWRFQNGGALKNGLMAARLAKEGLVASQTALEGKCGFFACFGGPELRQAVLSQMSEITRNLGQDLEVGKNVFKPYPTCGYNQVGVEVAVAMAKKYDIRPEDIDSIQATVAPENKNYPGGDFHGPFATLDQALLSKPFSLATAMMYRNITVDMYLSRMNAPEIQQLAQKVSSKEKEGMGFLDYRIDVKLKDGREVSGDQGLVDMKNYSLDRNMEIDKFCRLSSNLLAKEDALKIVQTIFQLKDMPDLTGLSRMLKKAK